MRWRGKNRAAQARREVARALGLLVVVIIGVAVIIAVLGAVAGALVNNLVRASESEGTDPREQLQQVLAAEMSWHHAALEDLTATPEAMADTDRYVAGEIDLNELTRRTHNRREQQ